MDLYMVAEFQEGRTSLVEDIYCMKMIKNRLNHLYGVRFVERHGKKNRNQAGKCWSHPHRDLVRTTPKPHI